MIFDHHKTKKPALWITPYEEYWLNQDDPDLYRIRSYEDLPDPKPFYTSLGIPEFIWKVQGKEALWHYFRAFIGQYNPDNLDSRDDFWLILIPCGFPDGVIPGE